MNVIIIDVSLVRNTTGNCRAMQDIYRKLAANPKATK